MIMVRTDGTQRFPSSHQIFTSMAHSVTDLAIAFPTTQTSQAPSLLEFGLVVPQTFVPTHDCGEREERKDYTCILETWSRAARATVGCDIDMSGGFAWLSLSALPVKQQSMRRPWVPDRYLLQSPAQQLILQVQDRACPRFTGEPMRMTTSDCTICGSERSSPSWLPHGKATQRHRGLLRHRTSRCAEGALWTDTLCWLGGRSSLC